MLSPLLRRPSTSCLSASEYCGVFRPCHDSVPPASRPDSHSRLRGLLSLGPWMSHLVVSQAPLFSPLTSFLLPPLSPCGAPPRPATQLTLDFSAAWLPHRSVPRSRGLPCEPCSHVPTLCAHLACPSRVRHGGQCRVFQLLLRVPSRSSLSHCAVPAHRIHTTDAVGSHCRTSTHKGFLSEASLTGGSKTIDTK